MLVHQYLQESRDSQFVGCKLCPYVAERFFRSAKVFCQKCDDVFVLDTFFEDLGYGDGQSLFKRISRVNRRGAANVDAVKYATDIGDEFTALKYRANHRDVVQVTGAVITVIGNQYVAGLEHLGRVALQHYLQCLRHCADKGRNAARRLGELSPLCVHQADSEVPVISNNGRE